MTNVHLFFVRIQDNIIMKKEERIYLRISEQEKEEIKTAAKKSGFSSVSKYIIESTLKGKVEIKDKKSNIYTLTLSPTLDYFIELDEFSDEYSNDYLSSAGRFEPGGRGINTSRILKVLGVESTALHRSGGFSGGELWRLLEERGIEQHRFRSKEDTRININVSYGEDNSFALQRNIGSIFDYVKDDIIAYVSGNLKRDDIFVFTGAFLIEDYQFVKTLLLLVNEIGCKIIFNTSSSHLKRLLIETEIDPLLVVLETKNNPEVPNTKKEVVKLLDEFIEIGCTSTAYIMDANFSFYTDSKKKYIITTPKAKQYKYVGMADAFTAGYIAEINNNLNERLKWAAASQKVETALAASINFNAIQKTLKYVDISEI